MYREVFLQDKKMHQESFPAFELTWIAGTRRGLCMGLWYMSH